jgi:hypothetical protein
MLIKAGHDPSLPLHTYRGEVLYMRMRLPGEGAHLEPSLSGGFVRLQEEASTHTLQQRELPQRLPLGLTALSYTKDHLMWHGDRLLLRTGRRLLAILEPDSEWPGMWRVRLPNGDLPRHGEPDARQGRRGVARARQSEVCGGGGGSMRGGAPPRSFALDRAASTTGRSYDRDGRLRRPRMGSLH